MGNVGLAGSEEKDLSRTRQLISIGTIALWGALFAIVGQAADLQTLLKSQYIAVTADPLAQSGTGAQDWGIWKVDPGPRGVYIKDFTSIDVDGRAPAGWTFDPQTWWLEEYGRVMEAPTFPIEPGRYVVTGGRTTMALLTIKQPDENGDMAWTLSQNATLYDVTHLGCRSAVYTPIKAGEVCSPSQANPATFPIRPGDVMPSVTGCTKKEYAVLIVIAKLIND